MTDITTIIEVIVSIIATVVGTFLIPYIKRKASAEKLAEVVKWLEIACYAAEEAARTGLIDKAEKYGYAVEFLEKRDITFDAATTEALINSTVYDLFNRFKDDVVVPSEENTEE
jgi:hypothetical protein